jgi:hypothetical protein
MLNSTEPPVQKSNGPETPIVSCASNGPKQKNNIIIQLSLNILL